jgi:hypothetical protein
LISYFEAAVVIQTTERVARNIATMGEKRLLEYLSGLSEQKKALLRPIWAELKAIATEADAQAMERQDGGYVPGSEDEPL